MRGAEARVARVDDDAHLGELSSDELHGAVRGGVVHHGDFEIEPGGLNVYRERIQTLSQQGWGAERDDRNAQVNHLSTGQPLKSRSSLVKIPAPPGMQSAGV